MYLGKLLMSDNYYPQGFLVCKGVFLVVGYEERHTGSNTYFNVSISLCYIWLLPCLVWPVFNISTVKAEQEKSMVGGNTAKTKMCQGDLVISIMCMTSKHLS